MSESAEALGSQHLFDFAEGGADFLHAGERFFARERRRRGFRDPWQRHLVAANAIEKLLILLRGNQLIVAAAEKFDQIVEKLAEICSANEVLEGKLGDSATQVNPKVFVGERRESFAFAFEKPVTVGVKGARLNLGRSQRIDALGHALA